MEESLSGPPIPISRPFRPLQRRAVTHVSLFRAWTVGPPGGPRVPMMKSNNRRRSRDYEQRGGDHAGYAVERTTHNFLQTGSLAADGQDHSSANLKTGETTMRESQRRRSSGNRVLNKFLPGMRSEEQPQDPYRLTLCDQIRLTFSSMNTTYSLERGVRNTGSTLKLYITKILASSWWDLLMVLMTFWMLAGDTFRITYVRKENDWKVKTFSGIALGVCLVDMVFRLIAESAYKYSFLFVMDVFSLYSIIWDIGTLIYQRDKTVWYTDKDEGYYVAGETLRVVCLLRLARLARLVRFSCRRGMRGLKKSSVAPSNSNDEQSGKGGKGDGNSNTEKAKSSVGHEFIEMTVRKVIVVIVVVCLFIPVLEPSRLLYPRSVFQFQQQGLDQLHYFVQSIYGNGSQPVTAADEALVKKGLKQYVITIPSYPQVDMSNTRVLYIKLQSIPVATTTAWLHEANFTLSSLADISRDYRPIESPAYRVGETIAYFRAKYWVRYNARLNLALRTFALLLAFAMGLAFTSIQNTVIAPIERMTKLVESLGENPLAKLEKTGGKPGRPGAAQLKRKGTRRGSLNQGEDTPETELLENALMKITELLQIGFGAAGAEIIAKNMKAGGGDVKDVLTRGGKTVTCIFAFIKMDDFSTLCSSLEEDVCTYINTIARIVHVDIVNNHGAPNKNIGQAFFCVWKREEQDEGALSKALKSPPMSPTGANAGGAVNFFPSAAGNDLDASSAAPAYKPQSLSALSEFALAAITKVRIDMHRCNRDETFSKFRANPSITEIFEDDFKCVMHYGLHIGEAIEGALGSVNKIDATYLSPNVNLASRLEAACHQFHVDFLMSGVLVNYFSEGIRKLCRQVDCVTVKGSKIPMDIWTFDISDYPPVPNQTWEDKETHYNVSTALQTDVELNPLDTDGFITKLKWLQASLPEEFRWNFGFGLRSYLDGEWRRAKDFFNMALEAYEDGPARLLLKVVEDGQCPEHWSGCRKLVEK